MIYQSRVGPKYFILRDFYVIQKNVEIERGAPRLVINYKPLNTALKWIRYPIPKA